MRIPTLISVLALLTMTLVLCAYNESNALQVQSANDRQQAKEKEAMLIQYLEVVTPNVDETCSALEKLHGVSFCTPDAGLSNARTTVLRGGGKVGVRAPMREDEQPVVRPYVLTKDIEAAVKAAQAAGAEIAIPPMEIPGHGRFAIYIHGGIEHGLWQL